MEGSVHATSIVGVEYMDLAVVDTPAGAVLHMLRPGLPLVQTDEAGRVLAGEVYFSEVLPGHIKAWKRHKRQTQHFCVPCGRLGIVLHDDREASLSRGALHTMVLGREDEFALLRIPCGVWYGFCALGDRPALICNAADVPHDPQEGEKLDWQGEAAAHFPFSFVGADLERVFARNGRK